MIIMVRMVIRLSRCWFLRAGTDRHQVDPSLRSAWNLSFVTFQDGRHLEDDILWGSGYLNSLKDTEVAPWNIICPICIIEDYIILVSLVFPLKTKKLHPWGSNRHAPARASRPNKC